MKHYYISLIASRSNGTKTRIFGGSFSTLYYGDTLGPGFEEIEKILRDNVSNLNQKNIFKETILLNELEIRSLIEKLNILITNNIHDISKINIEGHGVEYNFDKKIIPLRLRFSCKKERSTAKLISTYNLLQKSLENSWDFQILKHDELEKPFDDFQVVRIDDEV